LLISRRPLPSAFNPLRRDFFLHPAYAQQQAPHRRWQ